jgi:elongation factor G
VLLQPLVALEIVAPGERIGEVLGSLDRRRATILDVSDRGAAVKVIQCEAPLRGMFGYATELRSLTQGRAVFTMRFVRYDVA